MKNAALFADSEALEQSPAEASALMPPRTLHREPAPVAQPTKETPPTAPPVRAVRCVTHATMGAL